VDFRIANSIWYRLGFPFETEFLETCLEHFGADVTGLDFASPTAAPTINAWVADNTNDKIKEIVGDPIDPLTVIFLINAMYFYANWTVQFNPDLTQDDWFTLPDGTETPCKLMLQYDPGDASVFGYSAIDSLEIVDLPYGNHLFSMTVVLPGEGADIDSLIAELDAEAWDRIIDGLGSQSASLYMPRFELEYDAKLNDVLKLMGMEVAFGGGADFNRMCSDCGIFISAVKHKTYVKVNEEGTEAAAVTSVGGTTSVSEDIIIRVDRPFIFAIRESHSGTILFIGKIVDPGFE
jgi:serpin B